MIIRKIQDNQENEGLIIFGDMNGHTGCLGDQKMDNNGKFIMDLITDHNVILLNEDSDCDGRYTWQQNKKRSVIDFVLVNKIMYTRYTSMHIDEKQEIVNLSDQNLITVNINIC